MYVTISKQVCSRLSMLLNVLIIYIKKLLSSDWLKTSAFIKKHGCKSVTRVQITNGF